MIKVRKGQLRDAAEIVELQLLMAQETEGRELNLELVRLGVMGVFEKPQRGEYVVAEKEGKVVGSLLLTREWSDWRNQTVLWFQSVYVRQEERRKRVFVQMYEYLKEMVNNNEALAGLRLYTAMNNTQAQEIYEKLGMKKGGYYFYEWMSG